MSKDQKNTKGAVNLVRVTAPQYQFISEQSKETKYRGNRTHYMVELMDTVFTCFRIYKSFSKGDQIGFFGHLKLAMSEYATQRMYTKSLKSHVEEVE